MTKRIGNLLAKPLVAGLFIMSASVFALGFALISEHVFGLEPCILCIYQRVPYVITALAGLLIILLHFRGGRGPAAILTALAGLVFLVGGLIAFYHVGVEQHWWRSVFEGCRVDMASLDAENLLAQIENAQAARCDQIPWQLFGISMAGYNALMSAVLSMTGFISAYLIYTRNIN